MDDDFNTPEALAVMQGVARELNGAKAAGDAARAAGAALVLRTMGKTLGILQQDPEQYLKRGAVGGAGAGAGAASVITDAEIEAALEARGAARAARDFKESDRIRDRLRDRGMLLEDKPGGASEWRRS